uniref:Uncharacterized protein n=1 Tax=Solanum tuberosum TaxID=4113 RepID=M1DPK4_SOLTU
MDRRSIYGSLLPSVAPHLDYSKSGGPHGPSKAPRVVDLGREKALDLGLHCATATAALMARQRHHGSLWPSWSLTNGKGENPPSNDHSTNQLTARQPLNGPS